MSKDGRDPSSSSGDADALVREVAHAPPHDVGALDGLDPVRVATFRIVGRLGRGGMGAVYRAEDEALHRLVALKVPHALLSSDPERRSRFLREARAAAALNHPNVAAVYQVGEAEGRPYIAMELIEGVTLRQRLAEGPASASTARALAAQMARGLAAAHGRGIVHRDFKPENVMITHDGVVKLLDFGLAKDVSGPQSDRAFADAETDLQLTRDGAVLGTTAYMSPEQVLGMHVDARSDVFAFGIVLYEMLAGRRPFVGATPGEIRAAIAREAPPALPQSVLTADAALARVALRCMSKSVQERYQDAAEIARALEHEEEPEVARAGSAPASASPARRPWAAAVGVLVLATGGALILLAPRRATTTGHAAPSASGVAAAPAWECASDSDCARTHAAGAWHCHSKRHVCLDVASADCTAHLEPGDSKRSDVVWVGGMFPLSTEPDFDAEMRGAELARRELAQALGTSADRTDEMRVRPIGLVVCDEGADAVRAARHLAEEVEVPAVLGFRGARSVLATVPSIFLPNRVLSFLSIAQQADLTAIPEPSGAPRLIWRSTLSGTGLRAPTSALLSEVIEPRVRTGGLHDSPLRVAAVRGDAAHAVADADFRALHFNGRSALENGANFRQFVARSAGASADAGDAALVDELLAFAPHVLYSRAVPSFAATVIVPLEKKWKGGPRPFYIVGSEFEPALVDFIGKDEERRRRFFALSNVSTPVNSELVLRYNLAFPRTPVTLTTAPQPSYDAFYALAYAVYALGDAPVDGPALSRSMAHLVPPGHEVDVGPATIFEALGRLRAEGRIDLRGAMGTLDFDPATGEAPVDYAILCCGVDERGRASGSIESGLVYDGQREALRGTLRCP